MKIELTKIKLPRFQLRAPDRESLEYLELRTAMSTRGQDNSILVRPRNGEYELVDGGHRLACAEDLNWSSIDCTIREMTDQEAFLCQLTNAHTIPTTSEQYREHLRMFLEIKPETTIAELAGLICKSQSWVKRNLKLIDLDDRCRDALRTGELSLTNAYHLTRLPESGRPAFVDQAMTLPTHQFKLVVAEEIRRRQVRRKADNTKARLRAAGSRPMRPRPFSEVRNQLQSNRAAAEIVADHNPKSRLEAFQMGVLWAYQQDIS